MEAARRRKKEGRHRVVVLLWLGVVIMAVFLMVMWHNGAVRSRGKMEKDKIVWRRRRSGGNVVHGEAVIRDNDDDVFGDHDNGNRRRDRRDAIVVFYEPGARDTSSTTDERTMTESEGDEETQSARDVKGRFMCVFEAAARALVSVDSDGAALASTTAMNVGREVIVYADDISLVEESLEKLRHSLHSYTYMSGDNEEVRSLAGSHDAKWPLSQAHACISRLNGRRAHELYDAFHRGSYRILRILTPRIMKHGHILLQYYIITIIIIFPFDRSLALHRSVSTIFRCTTTGLTLYASSRRSPRQCDRRSLMRRRSHGS